MVRSVEKIGIEEIYFNIIMSNYNEPIAHILNGETTSFPPKI